MTAPVGPPPPTTVVVPGTGWVDVASRVVVQVGFPVVVAGVLLWYILTKFQDNMVLITDRMASNTQAAASLVQHQAALVEQEKIIFGELKTQTGELHEQTTALKQIAESGRTIITMHNEELGILRDMQRESKP